MTSNPLVGDNPVDVTVEEGEGSRTLQRKSTATFEVNHPYKDTINCPDALFGLLFLAAVTVVFYLGVAIGGEYIMNADLNCPSTTAEINMLCMMIESKEDEIQSLSGFIGLFKIFGITAGVSVLLSIIWVRVILCCASFVMKAVCIIATIGLVVASCVCVQEGFIYAQYVMLPMALIIILYYALNFHRIEYAGATLECACEVVLSHPMIFVVKIVTVIFQLAWVFLFAMAALGIYLKTMTQEYADDKATLVMETVGDVQWIWVSLVFVFFWGQQVLEGAVVCTVAKVTAEWWFLPKNTKQCCPTLASYAKMMTMSLGSIAFGAMFVAAIETLDAWFTFMIKMSEQEGATGFSKILSTAAKPVVYCLSFFIKCIKACAEYMTAYAFVFIGMHGYGFCKAGSEVVGLLKNHTISTLGNDAMATLILSLANVAMGLATAMIAVVLFVNGPAEWREGLDTVELPGEDPMYTVAGIAFLIGHAICSVFLASLKSANKGVFILWLESPHVLERNRPKVHRMLKNHVKHIKDLQERKTDMGAAEEEDEEGGGPTEETQLLM